MYKCRKTMKLLLKYREQLKASVFQVDDQSTHLKELKKGSKSIDNRVS